MQTSVSFLSAALPPQPHPLPLGIRELQAGVPAVAESSRLESLCHPAATLWFYLLNTQWCVYVSPALDSATLSFPCCGHTSVLRACPANRPVRTVLLGFMCMGLCTMFAFLSLAHLTLWPPLNSLTMVCRGQCISFHFFCYSISNQYTPFHAMVIGIVS